MAKRDDPGLEAAAKYHDNYARILRSAIAERVKHFPGISMSGELLWRAEEHESAALEIRALKTSHKKRPQP